MTKPSMTREDFLAEMDARCQRLRDERRVRGTLTIPGREVESTQVNALAGLIYDILDAHNLLGIESEGVGLRLRKMEAK